MKWFWVRGPSRPPLGLLICYKDSRDSAIVANMTMIYYSRRTKAKSWREKVHWVRLRWNGAPACRGPLPVSSHSVRLVPPVSNWTAPVKGCLAGKLARDFVPQVFTGGGQFRHIAFYTVFVYTVQGHSRQWRMVGTFSKSTFQDPTQRLILPAGPLKFTAVSGLLC